MVFYRGQKTPNARQGITTDALTAIEEAIVNGQKTPNARQGITTKIGRNLGMANQ